MATTEKGIFTTDQETWLVTFLMALFAFKGIKKLAAKLVLPKIISYLDDQIAASKLSDETQTVIKTIINYGIAGDTDGLTTYINEQVDIAGLDEEDEGNIINTIVKLGLKYIKKNVNKISLT